MGESFAQQGTAASPVTNTGEGCGGSPGPASATGYAGFGGQLGYWLASTAGPAIYGWAQWINASTNIESGVCNYTPPSSPPYSWPPEVAYPASSSITVQQSGTYTVDLAGASGAGGWATSGAGNYGTGGPGSTLGFQVPLDQGEQLTFVGGCTGFGDLGGLGFSNGGSSGLAVQDFGQGNAGDSNSNGTPVLTGVGGGGGGSSAVCLTSPSVNAGTSTPTCTAGEPNGSGTNSPTPLCTTTDPSGFSGTCVLAIAGGGGGGGAYGGAVDTGCNGAGNNGNGGLTEGASPGTAFNGYWDGTSYTVGTWWPGAGVPGKPLTNAGAPTAYTNPNPDPTRLNGGYVGNGGNGAYNYHGYPPDPRSGAGGGGGGFVGGWADPWWYGAVPWGQSLPTSADPAAAPVAVNNVTTTSGSNQVTVSGGGFPGVAVGDVVYETNDGPGIPFDTTVTGIDNNNNTLTMSANASASGTVTLHFTPYQTGSGSAGTCGAGGGSSWSFVPNTQVGGNSGSGFATVYYYPPAANQPTTMSPVSIDSTP